ncbi:MAG: hypothetical protein COC16_01425 [Lutibacter sp.]|nr:MAG: hypothetical protein COC16_01425 [Lutibacter sp.]
MYYIKEINHKNPLLNVVSIINEPTKFQSLIYPNLGATLQQLSTNGIEIIDGISRNEGGLKTYKDKYNSSFLFPFPSRIPAGKYSFQNSEFELERNEKVLNNALHGHIHNKTFALTKKETSSNSARITFTYHNNGNAKGYPFPYQLEITYIFNENKLTLEFKITNVGNSSFPFGIGWHPYFKTKYLAKSILNFNAISQLQFNDKMVPESETLLKYDVPFNIKTKELDDGFVLNKPHATIKTHEYTAQLDFSSNKPNSYLQVYTPPNRACIAVEPMTCSPNSFNNKNGLLILESSEIYNWNIDLKYSI